MGEVLSIFNSEFLVDSFMKLFKYIIVVLLIVGSLSTVQFYFINQGLRRQKVDIYGKMNELVVGKENYDVVFIGSSRINLTVNPAIIDSVTGLKSFNFGFDGANIVDFSMHVASYLKGHSKPGLMVLNIDPKMLNVDHEIKIPPSKYIPYIHKKEIYDTLSQYSNWPIVAKYAPFVAGSFYTDGIVNQSLQAYLFPNRKMENYYKGFSPLTKIWATGDKSAENLVPVIYTDKGLALFKHFLEGINKQGIRFRLIYSPQYSFSKYVKEHEEYIKKLNSIAFEYGYEVKDYSFMELCHDKNYFFDATHLNLTGANLFSQKLAEDIKITLLESK